MDARLQALREITRVEGFRNAKNPTGSGVTLSRGYGVAYGASEDDHAVLGTAPTTQNPMGVVWDDDIAAGDVGQVAGDGMRVLVYCGAATTRGSLATVNGSGQFINSTGTAAAPQAIWGTFVSSTSGAGWNLLDVRMTPARPTA